MGLRSQRPCRGSGAVLFGAGSWLIVFSASYTLARGTGHLARFVVFGSFVTVTPSPNDVDVLMLMDDRFDAASVRGEAAILFDHAPAQAYFGATIFWLRRGAVLGDEETAIEEWQIKRDGSRRGIVEVSHDQER